MHAKVILTISQGQLQGEIFEFDSRATCIIGRAQECHPRIPDRRSNRAISRYHCLLDINPPAIRIRDFGSKNGTFVNGAKIGQRQPHQTAQQGAKLNFPEYDLTDGDKIKIGNTVFRVSVEADGGPSAPLPDGGLSPLLSGGNFPAPEHNRSCAPLRAINLRDTVEQLLSQTGSDRPSCCQGYAIQTTLGKASSNKYGEVHLIRRTNTGEKSALKIMVPQVAVKESAQNWFLAEMEKSKLLRHPNLVRLKNFCFANGLFFLVEEFCNGGNVEELMAQRGGKLPPNEAVAIVLQVLEGLSYGHSAGLVHGNLKPSEFFLTDIGGICFAKLGVFGLDRSFDLAGFGGQSLTGTKGSMPFFMPRQQVLNFKYAERSVDVWAAAACLYYMITGTYPRDFTHNRDPFLTVLTTEAVAIAKRCPDIPRPLAKVIDWALVDNPEIQLKSAVDLKNALLKAHR